MTKNYLDYYDSPLGLIEIRATAEAVTYLEFVEEAQEAGQAGVMTERAKQQLADYFAGKRREFDLPLAFEGTDFQKLVWQQLLTIPYGQMISYQDLAKEIGKPDAVRAVGAANGQNPIAIIAPCHRVIGSDGHLTGYGGGLWRKEWLLKHEGALLL
jgi:methylated-DNA-[protein]-cysteine S-methyltransferase